MEKERKLQIIKAAEKRFAKHGVKKTTLDEIARDLRIGKSTIYHYFTSKEDLYLLTLRYQTDQYLQRVTAILNEEISEKERLLHYFRFKSSVFENYKLILSLFVQCINETRFEEEVIILQDLYGKEEKIIRDSLKKIYFSNSSADSFLPQFIVYCSWGIITVKRISGGSIEGDDNTHEMLSILIDASVKQ